MYSNYPYMPNNSPIQNFINTNNVEIEGRFLNENEDVHNILIKTKTLFVDEKNKKLYLKELDGSISKQYELIIPKDEKDIKIENLENQINEMRLMLNEYAKSNKSINNVEQSDNVGDVDVKSATKKSSK